MMVNQMPAENDKRKSLNSCIVVPLDGSKLAEIALPYAEELGARTGNDIFLLTVLEYPDESFREYLQKITDITKHHIKKYLLMPGSKEVEISSIILDGNPAETIVNFTREWNQNLIIMATHGRSGIGRWAVGSVADKVVRTSINTPVMLIRGKKARPDIRQKRLLRKTLVPLDGSLQSQAVIPHASRFAKKLEMDLVLFQAMQKNNENQNDVESYLTTQCSELERQGINASYQVRFGSPAEEIINFGDELAVDLVAMSTRGKSGLAPWILGSVAQKILLGGNTPLLLVRQQ
jgi:nucleotide-binding universal stress UspA family protein